MLEWLHVQIRKLGMMDASNQHNDRVASCMRMGLRTGHTELHDSREATPDTTSMPLHHRQDMGVAPTFRLDAALTQGQVR